jgi:hypothetical protein
LSWISKNKRFAQFALLAFAAGEISYAAADVLILRSVGPSARNYPAGKKVPDNTSFALRPGDSIVVLAGGGTRTFRGPGTFNANAPTTPGGLAAAAGVRRQTGAVRGGAEAEVRRPTDVWQVDISQSGRACVPAGRRPTLWRSNSQQTVALTITPQTGAAQTVNWTQGQATVDWPAAIPIVDGATYQLSWTGGTAPTRLTARTLTGITVTNLEAVATALIEKECRGQLDVLIASRSGGSAGGN